MRLFVSLANIGRAIAAWIRARQFFGVKCPHQEEGECDDCWSSRQW